jgi:hypothetical protein
MKIEYAIGELNDLYERNGYKPILAPGDLYQTNWVNDPDVPLYFEMTLATGQVLRAHFRLLPGFMHEQAVVGFLLDNDPFPWESETSKIKGQTVRREIEALVTVLAPLAREIVAQDKVQRTRAYAEADARAKQAEIDRQAALVRADRFDPKS